MSRTKRSRTQANLQSAQLDLAAIDVVGEPESRHAHRHAGMDLPVDSEQLLEAVSGLSGGRAGEARVELADPETFGHQRAVLIGQVAVLAAEPVPGGRVEQDHGRGPAQDQVVALSEL